MPVEKNSLGKQCVSIVPAKFKWRKFIFIAIMCQNA